jgi:protein ImuB
MGPRDDLIASLPVHQRPGPRELGRRSEAANNPFKSREPARSARAAGARQLADGSSDQGLAPLVTAGTDKQRVVIAAADPAAIALGLYPGMALTQARALVPELDVRDADPAGDLRELQRLALFGVRRWSPTAQVDAPDGLLLDLTGVPHLFGGEECMARRMVQFCRRIGLDARIAIAGTAGAAHALARFGGHAVTICPLHGELGAIGGLPLAALRLDQRQRDAAQRLGIERINDLIAMPRAPLSRRFGAALLTRLDQAIGRVAEPLIGIVPFEVPMVERRFAEPIGAAETIARAMAELAKRLAADMLARGLGVRLLRLVCERVDREEQIVTVGTARGTRDAAHMLRLLGMKIETIEPGFGIETMRLIALRTEPLGAVALSADLGGDEEADVALLIDQIVTRLGRSAIYRSTMRESDVPERGIGRVAPMEPAISWPTLWPRPARLLRRPERIDNVLSELPDQPPRRFVWRGATHSIVRADGPERISGEWWRRTGESYAVRDYFRVENERGERFWVFRRGDGEDRRSGDLSWHIHGIFG